MTSLRAVAVSASLSFVAVAHGQRTIVVDAGGGGQFTDLPPAISASVAGDTIVVRPGAYSKFLVQRGIKILGGAGVIINRGTQLGMFVVTGVPSGETVLVSGLTNSSINVNDYFTVLSCAGTVHLERISSSQGGQVHAAASVTVNHSDIGRLLLIQSNVLLAGLRSLSFVDARESRVALNDVRIQMGLVPALALAGGRATVAADVVIGSSSGVSSAIGNRGGTLIVDPSARLLSPVGVPPIVGPYMYAPVPATSARVDNNVFTVSLTAPTALRGHTLLSLPLSRLAALGVGDLWLDPAAHIVLDSGAVPVTGIRSTAIALPPRGIGQLVAVQALVVYPTGLVLSTASLTTLD